MIIYSAGTIVNTSFTQSGTATRREIVDGIATALASGDWSYVSGEGTGDVLMECADTATGHNVRARFWDSGSGNYATWRIQDAGGSYPGQTQYLAYANNRQWFVVCHPSSFYVFTSVYNGIGQSAMGGALCADQSFLDTVFPPGTLGWGSGSSDQYGNLRRTFRMNCIGNRYSIVTDAAVYDYDGAGVQVAGQLMLVARRGGSRGVSVAPTAMKWVDGSYVHFEPELAASFSGSTQPSKIVGQIPDAFVTTRSYGGTEERVWDSYDWRILSNDSPGVAWDACEQGCFAVRIS